MRADRYIEHLEITCGRQAELIKELRDEVRSLTAALLAKDGHVNAAVLLRQRPPKDPEAPPVPRAIGL